MTKQPQLQRRPGGQPKPLAQRKRNNLTFRTRDELRERLEKAAAASGRSVSEEIEYRLNRDFGWEATKGDITEMLAQARAQQSAARVHALRAAGLMILRDIEARPTRVIVDLETLLAEADGIARGLRPGFIEEKAPPAPPRAEPRRTAEEERDLLRTLEDIMRKLDEAVARARAADAAAAAKSDDDEAA
jgi:hypothetical protein